MRGTSQGQQHNPAGSGKLPTESGEADGSVEHTVRLKGNITTWNSERGFGFVTPAGGGERVFVHITAIADRTRPPAEGEMVTYDLTVDERKRPRAARVRRSAQI